MIFLLILLWSFFLVNPVQAVDVNYDALWSGAPLLSRFPVGILIENANVGDSFYVKLYGGINGNNELKTLYNNVTLNYDDPWNWFPVEVIGVGGSAYVYLEGVGIGEIGDYNMRVLIVSKKNTNIGYTTPVELMIMTKEIVTPTPTPTLTPTLAPTLSPTLTPTNNKNTNNSSTTNTATPIVTSNSSPTPTLNPSRYNNKNSKNPIENSVDGILETPNPNVTIVEIGTNQKTTETIKRKTKKRSLWWRVVFLSGSGLFLDYVILKRFNFNFKFRIKKR